MSSAFVVTGQIVTMDPDRPEADALAVVDGRIAAVGARGDVAAAVPSTAPVLALPGTITPGFIDSHVHMLWWGRDLERLSLDGVRSVAEVAERIAAFARANPDRLWIEGSADIDPDDLAEGRFPTRAELDAAANGRPLFLDRRSHDALVNSAALHAAGITAATPDPPGGVIERDADGEPTGFLVERPAAELVERAMPPVAQADRLRWLDAIQRRFLAAGITSVVDPALTPEELDAYRAAHAAKALTVRTTAMPLGDGERDPATHVTRFGDLDALRGGDVLSLGPMKLFLDGGGSLGTALLDEDWPGTDGYRGNQTTSTDGLFAWARWCAANGHGLGVHAVGTAAIDLYLDAAEAADAVHPIDGLGFTLIHAYLWPTPRQMARARDLGVLVATQSPLQWSFGPSLVARFGAERVGRAHPLRSWLQSGAIVGGGSDGPGAHLAPLWALWQMQRRTIAGSDEPVGAQEAITAEQALHLYTAGAAQVALAPDRGRLAPGHVADLVALDADPLRASPETVRDASVLVTMAGGEIVHDAR